MNRSLYLNRRLDHIDRAIIAALYEDGRRTIKDVAELIDMASPSITARIDKLKDAGAIMGIHCCSRSRCLRPQCRSLRPNERHARSSNKI